MRFVTSKTAQAEGRAHRGGGGRRGARGSGSTSTRSPGALTLQARGIHRALAPDLRASSGGGDEIKSQEERGEQLSADCGEWGRGAHPGHSWSPEKDPEGSRRMREVPVRAEGPADIQHLCDLTKPWTPKGWSLMPGLGSGAQGKRGGDAQRRGPECPRVCRQQ